MDWLWKVLVAGYLTTGTCGAPLVDEKTPEAPPADTTKPPAPTPPKPPEPKPPEPTYSWQKISVPGYADGTFRKIVGTPRNPDYPNVPYSFMMLSKGRNNFFIYPYGKGLSDFQPYMSFDYTKKFSDYEILDINYTKENIASPQTSGTTTDSGGKALVGGNANLTFSTSCKPGRYYPYADPSPSTTNKLVAIHNGVAVGPSGVFSVPGDGFPIAKKVCHLFITKPGTPGYDVVWLYNDLTGVWVGKTKQFFIGKTSTGTGDFIFNTVYPFQLEAIKDSSVIALDDKNGAGLNAIWGISDTNVIVVGNDSTVIQYDGTKWNDIAIPSELGTIDLTTVYATPDGDYVIGGEGGVVLVYKGGAFTIHPLPVTDKVISVHAWSSSDIYALTDNALYRFYLH